jgi:hypothetical protein
MSPEEFQKFYPLVADWLQNVLATHAPLGQKRRRL